MAGYWTFERLGFSFTLLGMGAAAVGGWVHFNDKLDALGDRIAAVQKDGADDLCQQIVLREIAAIELGKKEIAAEVDGMTKEYGCLKRYGSSADIADAAAYTGSNAAVTNTSSAVDSTGANASDDITDYATASSGVDADADTHAESNAALTPARRMLVEQRLASIDAQLAGEKAEF